MGTLRRIGLDKIISSRPTRQRDLVAALIVAHVIEPGSKLAAARGLCEQTASTSLGETLNYVEWHMRQDLAPVLFDDEDPQAGEALRRSVVAPAHRSPVAQAKAANKRTAAGAPVHSFQTLLSDLATICRNRIQPDVPGAGTFEKTTQPTAFQEQILTLLNVGP